MAKSRVWEIDVIRATLILIMIVHHTTYNLIYFFDYNLSLTTPAWNIIAPLARFLFIFLSGISSGYSRNSVFRGVKVLSYGLVVTIVTYPLLGEEYVRFGILHFLGTCMIIYPILSRMRPWLLAACSMLLIYLWPMVDNAYVSTYLLLPLGFTYQRFSSVDYFPLLQYLPAFLLGILAYKFYYYQKKSIFSFQLRIKPIEFLSTYSLQIYLLHQPVVLGLLWLAHSIF